MSMTYFLHLIKKNIQNDNDISHRISEISQGKPGKIPQGKLFLRNAGNTVMISVCNPKKKRVKETGKEIII